MPTIGQTRFTVATVIEKSIRRCGLPPSSITPETISTAREDLFMLLMSLSSRGLNLWCIDQQYITLQAGKATYQLPAGTLDILNLNQSRPTIVTTGEVAWVAVRFDTLPLTATFDLLGSDDGFATSDVVQTLDTPLTAGLLQWYRIDPIANYVEYDVVGADELRLASEVSDIEMSPFNRDDYANQPGKSFQSDSVTNYWFEKLITPRVTAWPVPNSDTNFLTLFRYRQIEDISDLRNDFEIPSRWYEAICWHLALRLCFELPGVQPERMAAVKEMAGGMTLETEATETDSAPIRIRPNIGVYTA